MPKVDLEQQVLFPEKDRQILEAQSFHGERARQVKDGQDWEWVKQYIFGAMQDQAIGILQNAKTEEDRLKAQQMFLACNKPIQLLDFLISQGDAARASLVELNATLQEEQNNG